MMDCKAIHETVIRDIIDVIHDVKNAEELKGIRGRANSFKSIAQASQNLTLVFPVIISKNMNIENAAMVAKALERKAVSMLQMLFSAISITDNDNGIDYIRKFHNNMQLDDKVSVDGFLDALDKFIISNEAYHITDMEMYNRAKQDLRNLNITLPDNVNENSISDFRVNSFMDEQTVVLEKKKETTTQTTTIRDEIRMPYVINLRSGGGYSENNSNDYKKLKDQQDIFRNQLLASDVKKANELVPTMMTVNFITTGYDENIASQMVIGVKAKMYPVDSVDLLNRIVVKNQDKNGLLKLVKATTREISFVRDFLLAIDKAKIDALSHSNRGSSSKMWKILERRALKSKIRRTLGQINDASAISTIVISQEEVEFLKKTENVDIENPNIIRPIMESYNLMSVCIVDETIEVCKFIFDTGNDVYENVSFSHLERESSDGSYRKVLNLMTKVR